VTTWRARRPSRRGRCVIEPQAGKSAREETADPIRFGDVEITSTDLKSLSSSVIVDRLVAGGVSRLTAERIVAIERGTAEPGRARPHATARR
jgi:hypothetical protein